MLLMYPQLKEDPRPTRPKLENPCPTHLDPCLEIKKKKKVMHLTVQCDASHNAM